jgi:MFS family permease
MPLILFLSVSIHACYIGSKVVVSLLALELGASQALIGVIAALYAVLPMMIGVYSGRLADTIGMRIPLLIGACCTTGAMLIGFVWQTLPALFATAIIMGAAFVFHNVSIQSLTGSYGPPEQRARNFSILTIGYSVSSFIGPVIAGFSIDHGGHGRAFLAFALLTVLPILLLILYPAFTRVPSKPSGKQARRALDLLRDPPLRRVIVMSGLMVASYELYAFYMPLHAHSKGLSASAIGIIMATYAAATFLSRFFLPFVMRSLSTAQVLSRFMLISACGFVLIPLLETQVLLMLVSFAIGIGSGVGQPLSMTVAFERSPAGRAGEVTGLRLTFNNISRIVIPLVSGSLGALLGSAPVFWMNAANLLTISWLARR